MELTQLLRDASLSTEDLMRKIEEDIFDSVHDQIFCDQLDAGADPARAAKATNDAMVRLMDPVDIGPQGC